MYQPFFSGSIINVGLRKIEPTKKYKKVEHKFEKSVKMDIHIFKI